ncbi:MAG: hypothetical protein LBI33_05605 [Propionibacteriaceae bacterium]|jgi:hypothetical protein|nr:hypothetical protein [Propionibacteriaceae bacterium]
MKRQLIWLGPWADEEHPERPRPQDHVDPSWDEHERGLVSLHLEHSLDVGAPLDGDGECLMCGKKMYRGFVQTDGMFTWRSGLAHYVDEHCVRPPQRFIDHVLAFCDMIDELDADDWQWWDADPYAGEENA